MVSCPMRPTLNIAQPEVSSSFWPLEAVDESSRELKGNTRMLEDLPSIVTNLATCSTIWNWLTRFLKAECFVSVAGAEVLDV